MLAPSGTWPCPGKGRAMPTGTPIDVRDMRIVHATFRRAYAEAAQLVRAAPTPSPARVAFLADHVDFGISLLHHHHEGEDLLLYPKLIERVPEMADSTARIEHEHQEVAGAIDAVTSACATWRRTPTRATGEALASALESLNAVLQPHLDHEEGTVVPLAAVHLTQAEWDELGEHGRSSIPRQRMPVAFGMLLEPLSEDDREHMRSQLPAPVRLLSPVLIDRPWKKYAATLRHGS